MIDFPRNTWSEFFSSEKEKSYFKELLKRVEDEYSRHICYPPKESIFEVYKICPPENIKVVILGQDPYHGPDQAHGLSFSVNDGVDFPPSLRNILKELESDIDTAPRLTGNLEDWVKQGVFLLNNVLTVQKGIPDSHRNMGWETFTQNTIEYISSKCDFIVFILWGAKAEEKAKLIDSRHCILRSAHPSPLSSYRGFFGSKPFSKANSALTERNKTPIQW